MQEAILYINEVGKRKNKPKIKKTFPTISRADLMSGILSENLSNIERSKLSDLYLEILCIEKQDLKYISEIPVSSKSDLEIYEMIKKNNKMSKFLNKEQEN